MRTYRTVRNVVAMLGAAAALMVPSVQAAQLNNISVGRNQDFTVVTLYSDADVAVSHQAIEAKSGKPDRIVVDLTGVEHALPRNNFDELPASSIKRIRTSQFAVSPEPVVRVVLDLAVAAPYKVETEGHNVRIMVSLPSDPPMASTWSARNTPVLAQSSATSSPAGTQEAIPMPVAPPEATEPPAPMPKAVTVATTDTKSSAGTSDMPTPAAVPPASETGSGVAALEPQPEADSESPEVPMPMPQLRPEQVIDYNLPRPGAMADASEPSESTPTNDAAQTAAKPADANKNGSQNKASGSEPVPTTSDNTTSADLATTPPAPTTPNTKNQTAEPATADANGPSNSEPAMPVANPAPEYAAGEDGSAPVASLTTLPPMEPGVPEVVPQRGKIVYHTNGRRDPFRPLLQVGAGYNSSSLPDVGSLRLVGLLHDVGEAWGLFEDANGYGYILKEGDRVKNGRLNKLTNTRAYFQLNEFGWSRSVELELEPEG